MDTNFSGKLDVSFAPKITFLIIFPTSSMLNLKRYQIWDPWVITKILMSRMPGLEAKKFLYFFSTVVFYTLIRGCNKKIFPESFQILLFRSSAIIKSTKLLQKLTFLWQWKFLMSTLCHSAHMMIGCWHQMQMLWRFMI